VTTIDATSTHILLVSDAPAILGSVRSLLPASSYELTITASLTSALQPRASDPPPDLVLVELKGVQAEALQTVPPIRTLYPGAAIIVLSSPGNTPELVEAVRLGAKDYLTMPLQEGALQAILNRHSVTPRTSKDVLPSAVEVEKISDEQFFVATGPEMRKLHMQAKLLAGINVPVLILGESGTGKEVIARLIHKLSSRPGGRFLKVNCAAFTAEFLESELFGEESAAFTGTQYTRPGKFELYDKGTILLHEIDEMPAPLQVKLLRALQDKQIFRRGGEAVINVDVRILASANGDIQQALKEKRLREDLYYRLSTFTVLVPPLRQRREEIPLLMGHFMQQMAKYYNLSPRTLSPAILDACQSYWWPGNLRQLENFVKAYLVIGDEALSLSELERCKASDKQNPYSGRSPGERIEHQEHIKSLRSRSQSAKGEAERNAIAAALRQTGWNRKAAARLLQVSYRTLLYKIEQYRMAPPNYLTSYIASSGHRADGNEG